LEPTDGLDLISLKIKEGADMHKFKHAFFKMITLTAGFIFLFAACCLDSDSWAPAFIAGVTGAYLLLCAYVHSWNS
jgi:hypothetical protein